MPAFLGVLLAAQLYLATPFTETPEGWPELKVEIHARDQVFPDECQKGLLKATQWLAGGAVGCSQPNLYTRTCKIYYSNVHPMSESILAHEKQHCAGQDHPVPGGVDLTVLTNDWIKRGRPMMSPEEFDQWRKDSEGGQYASEEIRKHYKKQWRNYVSNGKRHDAAILAAKATKEAESLSLALNAETEPTALPEKVATHQDVAVQPAHALSAETKPAFSQVKLALEQDGIIQLSNGTLPVDKPSI